jgi:mannose-6-phosphate isomerase-like protein (cupin superfamily)
MTNPTGLRPSNNPFLALPVDADAADAEHLVAARQDKPWGHELLFADGSNGYVGKLIHITAGRSLSLQLHHRKDETIHVVSGEMVLEAGVSAALLERTTMIAGDTVHVPATVIHRITAVTDVVLIEASTAGVGWQHDVVRLSDDYGRAGTSAP